MKPIPTFCATLLLLGISAHCSLIAADTNSPSTWKYGAPHPRDGYVLVRLEAATINSPGYEFMGHNVHATFQPIEFKYPGGGGGGGGYPGHPFEIKPVETKIGKAFDIGILSGNSMVPKPQQSIANLLEACADEKDPKHLKLNLILSIPTADVADWKEEHDYSHWFIESLQIPNK